MVYVLVDIFCTRGSYGVHTCLPVAIYASNVVLMEVLHGGIPV